MSATSAVMVAVAACSSTTVAGINIPTNGRFANGNASGQYAIAQATGTVNGPSHIQLRVIADPAQSALVTWTMTCQEVDGGAGSKSGQGTVDVPTIETLTDPSGSTSCIVASSAQLHSSGTVTVALYNHDSAPAVSPKSAVASPSASGAKGADPSSQAMAASGATATGCSDDVVDLGDLGTWVLNASGTTCATAHSLLNAYENSDVVGETESSALNPNPSPGPYPLDGWECTETKFVPNRYVKWTCTRDGAQITFADSY